MVSVEAIERHDVHVDPRLTGQGVEEVADHVRLQLADHWLRELAILNVVGAAGTVDRDVSQRLVHRDGDIRRAPDSAMIPQRGPDCLSEADTNVLNGVVCVDAEVTLDLQRQVEQSMAGEEHQDVIERADAGVDISRAGAIDLKLELYLRFRRVAAHDRLTARHVRRLSGAPR